MTYSINYDRDDTDGYITNAVDWNETTGTWKRSEKEGVQWLPAGDIDKPAYDAILDHFGLSNCANDFPPHKLVEMSPEELGEARRDLEGKIRGLPKQEIVSDTIGDHIRIP
jgi:hypothetical protein